MENLLQCVHVIALSDIFSVLFVGCAQNLVKAQYIWQRIRRREGRGGYVAQMVGNQIAVAPQPALGFESGISGQ